MTRGLTGIIALLSSALAFTPASASAQPFAYVLEASSPFNSTCRFSPASCSAQLITVDIEQGVVIDVGEAGAGVSGPLALTENGRHLAWAIAFLGVAVLDRTTGGLVPGSDTPGELADAYAAPTGQRLFVLLRTSRALRTLDIGGAAFDIALDQALRSFASSPDGQTGYVGTDTGVTIVSVSDRVVTSAVGLDGPVSALAISPNGASLFAIRAATGTTAARLFRISTATAMVTHSTELAADGRMALTPDGSRLWVSESDRDGIVETPVVRAFDPATLTQVSTLSPPPGYRSVQNLAVTAANESLIVTTARPYALHVISLETGLLTRTIDLPPGNGLGLPGLALLEPTDVCIYRIAPRAVAVGPDGGSLQIDVPAPAGCTWHVSSESWIEGATPTQGSGPGSVTATVRPNHNALPRTGQLGVGMQTVTITQGAETPPADAPQAPVGLTGTVGDDGMATASWIPASTGAAPTHYVVEVGSVTGDRDLLVAPVGLLTTVSGPLPTGRYFLRVRAVNAAGAGPASNEISLLVPGPPAPPDNVSATWFDPSTLVLRWNAIGSSYIVEAGRAPGVSDVGAVTTTTRELRIPRAVLPDGLYYLRVKAVNETGVSAPSVDVPVGVGICSAAPEPPQLTVVSSGNQATADFLGQSAQWIERFRLVAGATPGGSEVGSVDTTGTSLSGTLTPGTYYLRAYAVNPCGSSTASQEAIVTIP